MFDLKKKKRVKFDYIRIIFRNNRRLICDNLV